jgi:hypothetical protein
LLISSRGVKAVSKYLRVKITSVKEVYFTAPPPQERETDLKLKKIHKKEGGINWGNLKGKKVKERERE